MGCGTSKIDGLPAVTLCRHRCQLLEDALYQSYALADAHLAYMNSLNSLGPSLCNFFEQAVNNRYSDPQPNNDSTVSAVKSLKSPPIAASLARSSSSSSSNSDSESESSHLPVKYDSEDEERGNRFVSFNHLHNHTNQPVNYLNHDFHYDDNPPPPPAPSSSAWDFLNFFEAYERYEPPFNQDSEVNPKSSVHDIGKSKRENAADIGKSKRDNGADNGGSKANNVDREKEQAKEGRKTDESDNRCSGQSILDVIREVKVSFESSAESGNEVLKILDSGKFHYYRKNAAYQAASMVANYKRSGSSTATEKIHSIDEDELVTSGNLSSTLRKLCVWEMKLYEEVKAEEKMRVILARKCRLMRSLDEKGAEAHKVDYTQTLIMALSTKIKISIQVINKISIAVNKLRDEELWPHVDILIHRLLSMWKSMLECHRYQSHTVVQAKSLDFISFDGKLSDAHIESAIQLKIQLQNWLLSFSNWFDAQKGYVNALNGWLMRCLLHEPEQTIDHVAPFSPDRMGAPLVFVICNQWSQSIEKISEKEVIDAMHKLITLVSKLLEQYNIELQQRVAENKNMERMVKILEREEQKFQKVTQAREKRIIDLHSPIDINASDLQTCLKQIFIAMEKFAAKSAKNYEELHLRIEEGRTS
ncbi:hypothetical protein HS088_TW06G01402 [Tripterygium wilfordii]|uniref:Nitrate regulatory gene2 protein-like n=1 Tax=Tripterygium wilfordii TaxID=458696 RepID=A0A7J7DLK7_TRIWF|nr:protein ALTERED PHOSPHATE STARVATION RESPONSE 1-like isoform X2 [Tripterygium wilfordii]KAF5747221.1 hypothetical protein HS088_TW06G01402 [Tripterygium wilfordii]